MYKKLMRYINTTLLGGIAAILPLALVFVLFRWIVGIIQRWLEPIAEPIFNILNIDSRWILLALYIILVAFFLMSFFFIGVIIQTKIGTFFKRHLERRYLMKIPGYKIARETVMQFFGRNRSFFKEVVLVDLFNSGTLMTGFITDDQGEVITVFVPTGPNPTSGNIYHVQKDKVLRSGAPVEVGMKSIISCGAGSEEIFRQARPSPPPQVGPA